MLEIKIINSTNYKIEQLIADHCHNQAFAQVRSYCPRAKTNFEYLLLDPVENYHCNILDAEQLSFVQKKYFDYLEKLTCDVKLPIALLTISYEAFNFIERIDIKNKYKF